MDFFPRQISGYDGRARNALPPGCSTCTTSAPKSTSVWLACAPAGLVDRSRHAQTREWAGRRVGGRIVLHQRSPPDVMATCSLIDGPDFEYTE